MSYRPSEKNCTLAFIILEKPDFCKHSFQNCAKIQTVFAARAARRRAKNALPPWRAKAAGTECMFRLLCFEARLRKRVEKKNPL